MSVNPSESGMSRYYDTVTHRFINADDRMNLEENVLGANIFLYCVAALDDTTGFGIVDDFLFAPLASGFSEGVVMLMGG